MEEPENMLHPDLEIRLVDFLTETFGKRDDIFVLETHSLHILRAFQLAVAEGRIKPEDVAIYDFSIDEKRKNHINRIAINKDGTLDGDFKSGFSNLASNMELKIWEIYNRLLSRN
jgi:predicted ATPase